MIRFRFEKVCRGIVIVLGLLLTLSSCEKKEKDYEFEWEEKEPAADKPRFLWIDAGANFPDFANSKANIERDLTLAKETGFTDVVVDVRPPSGDVLFETDVMDQVEYLGAWLPSGYTRVDRTANWDYLRAFIDIGHNLGLKVHAAVNTFAGGLITSLGKEGVLYRDAEKRDWGTKLLTESGIENTLDQNTSGSKFFNPVNEEVQNYILDMLEDLAAYQELDGIFLDRGRFDGLDSDFSDYTRNKFESYLGQSVQNFPEDILTPKMLEDGISADSPPHFKKWMEFRVKVIYDFMEAARNRVKSVNPDVDFGVYVGAWYSSYYGVGVNWASKRYDTSKYYPQWATDDYKEYGYAELMDIILIGAYASPTRVYGTSEWTIEGFCLTAMDRIKGDAKVIGGPDVGNGAWATASETVINSAIVNSVDAAINACDGYFLFDMIHLKQDDRWQYVQEGIDAVTGQ